MGIENEKWVVKRWFYIEPMVCWYDLGRRKLGDKITFFFGSHSYGSDNVRVLASLNNVENAFGSRRLVMKPEKTKKKEGRKEKWGCCASNLIVQRTVFPSMTMSGSMSVIKAARYPRVLINERFGGVQ